MQIAALYFGEQTTRVDVVLDRYIEKDSIKGLVRSKKVGKHMPIRKFIERPHVPLPQGVEHLH